MSDRIRGIEERLRNANSAANAYKDRAEKAEADLAEYKDAEYPYLKACEDSVRRLQAELAAAREHHDDCTCGVATWKVPSAHADDCPVWVRGQARSPMVRRSAETKECGT